METKKTSQASLENKRVLFLEVGLILTLAAVIGAFSYSTSTRKVATLQATTTQIDDIDIIPITQELPPEPPQLPAIPVFSEVLDIVDNDIEVETIVSIDDNPIDIPNPIYIETVEEEYIEEEEIPIAIVEQRPSFMGGDANTFSRWIAQHLEYPEVAKEMGLSGRVILQFTIRKDGSVGNIKLLRSVDPVLDEEAIRVVGSSPRWEPGRQRNRAVNVTYQFPVIFQLR